MDATPNRLGNKCITLAANISDEELRMNKGITICLMHIADVTEVHHDVELIDLINEVNDVGIEMKESAISEMVPKETLTPIHQKSYFMFHKDYYPNSRINLLETELSNDSKQQLSCQMIPNSNWATF